MANEPRAAHEQHTSMDKQLDDSETALLGEQEVLDEQSSTDYRRRWQQLTPRLWFATCLVLLELLNIALFFGWPIVRDISRGTSQHHDSLDMRKQYTKRTATQPLMVADHVCRKSAFSCYIQPKLGLRHRHQGRH